QSSASCRSFRLAPLVFFLRHPPTPEISTLSLHDALPISGGERGPVSRVGRGGVHRTARDGAPRSGVADRARAGRRARVGARRLRSEEHTSELQSRSDLVCRLLLEKKKQNKTIECIIDTER